MNTLDCGYFTQCAEQADHAGPHHTDMYPEWEIPTIDPPAFIHSALPSADEGEHDHPIDDGHGHEFVWRHRHESVPPADEATLDVERLTRVLASHAVRSDIRSGAYLRMAKMIAAEYSRRSQETGR